MTAFTHVSSDGKRLCVPTTDARALDGDQKLTEWFKYNIDERVRTDGAVHLQPTRARGWSGRDVRCFVHDG